ncbi:MAG: type II toxin-antitoxin system VapC family toxin [Gammaproteobacteria bacterium]|nr:type II toxin-antitoxin system VapC family toxin [Gammaproteobacteria bacterium]MYH45339.1 type II toxin-antitoxin system VapC family toxin [Gammaproteobacteria bacterium]MYL14216.1 type II toxin-antitoxin system VapC family toxin [Gammaproteobacteria bacterium]
MILLDTNVVSETMKPGPDARVMDWLNSQDIESLWLSVTVVMELRFGAAIPSPGSRRRTLGNGIGEMVNEVFRGRKKQLDLPATRVFADRAATAQRRSRRIGFADAAIAAVAIASGFSVATRDTAPFLEMGADVINPWN